MRSVRKLKNVKGKTALVRVDFSVENPADSIRIVRALPTIELLKKKGLKVVLLSHRGQPKGKVVPELSLRSMLPFLHQHLGEVKFFENYDFTKSRPEIVRAKPGSVFLFENIRFQPEEEASDPAFAIALAGLGDLYVNEAFATCHRSSVSLTVLPTLLPAYAGLLLEKEVTQLTNIMKHPKQPLIVVLAGGKAADKFAVIENLYHRTKLFLIGGVLANTFLKAKGMAVDASIIDEQLLRQVKPYLSDPKIILPMDWRSSGAGKILDLGPLSVEHYADIMKTAGTVIWNGPMGHFETPEFAVGTEAIACAVAKTKAFTVVGGGETTQVIVELHLEKKIDFLSTGGGAMLAFLAGKKLPALEALSTHNK